jgi:phage terminase large subunit-like protein
VASLDGLTPSLWIGDEVAEFSDREILAKLDTTAGKRRNCLGLIISTPSPNPEGLFADRVTAGERILAGDEEDDSFMPILYGIDSTDDMGDPAVWPKANPNLEHGQPNLRDLKTMWNTKKGSAVGRAEFSRYICARTAEDVGNWLDMAFAPPAEDIDWADLRGRRAWCGLDLSKSLDLSALVVAVPLDDGRVALRGHYWWPSDNVRQRELDYRLPVRAWAAGKHLELTPGTEISYERILEQLKAVAAEFDLVSVAFDRWGAKLFAEQAVADGLPLQVYSQGIATMGPGCQLWQQYWVARKLRLGPDPIMRNACAQAVPIRDSNGNIKVNKAKRTHVIDPLVAAIMALHCWGGETRSGYEDL